MSFGRFILVLTFILPASMGFALECKIDKDYGKTIFTFGDKNSKHKFLIFDNYSFTVDEIANSVHTQIYDLRNSNISTVTHVASLGLEKEVVTSLGTSNGHYTLICK